jgi:hypothetical protein
MIKRFLVAALLLCPLLAHAQCGSYLGDKRDGSTVYLWIPTYDSTGAGTTVSALVVGDIKVYKDGGVTPRAATSGYAILGPDFNAVTGLAGVTIDLSDNGTAGFFQRGHEYEIDVGPFTVSAITTVHCSASFGLEYNASANDDQFTATVSVVDSQTKLRLTGGVGGAGRYRDFLVCIDDVSSLNTKDCAWITQSDGTDIWLERAMSFTVTAGPPGDLAHIKYIRRH